MKKLADQPKESDKGASMIEYSLIAVLIAIVCLGGVGILGRTTSTRFSAIGSSLVSAPN